MIKCRFFSFELKKACNWVFVQFYCHHGLIIELSSASKKTHIQRLSDTCLASVSSEPVTETGHSMQIPSVLPSTLSGCLSFNGLQILPAHSSSPQHFFPPIPFTKAPSFGCAHKVSFSFLIFYQRGKKIKPDVIWVHQFQYPNDRNLPKNVWGASILSRVQDSLSSTSLFQTSSRLQKKFKKWILHDDIFKWDTFTAKAYSPLLGTKDTDLLFGFRTFLNLCNIKYFFLPSWIQYICLLCLDFGSAESSPP